MDLDDLRIVSAVAKHGSMNRAAADLHMVQSSVTARIRILEEELGVRLFVRHSRGVRLSDAGTRLVSYADRIHTLFNEAVSSIREDGNPKGSLRIGSTEPTVSMRLPQIVAAFSSSYPAVQLSLTKGNSSELIQQVLDQDLDGAFVAAPVHHSELIQEPVFQEELVLATHSSIRGIDDLANDASVKAIVLDQGCSYRDLLSDVLKARHIAYEILSLASFDAIQSCVESGVGVTLLPKELYEKGWQHGSTHAHAIPEFSRPVDTLFIRRRESQQQSALNAFLEKSRAASNLQHIA